MPGYVSISKGNTMVVTHNGEMYDTLPEHKVIWQIKTVWAEQEARLIEVKGKIVVIPASVSL